MLDIAKERAKEFGGEKVGKIINVINTAIRYYLIVLG